MLITQDFVFVHMPKTGGNFIRQQFAEWVVEELPVHATAAQIPDRYRDRPAIAYVRNPWDWYVSMWAFQRGNDLDPSDPWAAIQSPTFEETIRRACGEVDAPIGRYLRKRDRDYYSALWWQMFGHDPNVSVIRFESLKGQKVNASDRGPYRDYYSPELRDLVAHKARLLIRTYGYEF